MKRVEDSRTENTFLIMNKHINCYGRLFGGVLMQWIDEMAGIVARSHAGTIVTTACVDNLNFKAGAYLGDVVVLIGKLTYVGRTSMEVRIDTYVEYRMSLAVRWRRVPLVLRSDFRPEALFSNRHEYFASW